MVDSGEEFTEEVMLPEEVGKAVLEVGNAARVGRVQVAVAR